METKRVCPECKDPILGRIDKKFCSDQCRNSYNNRRYGQKSTLVRKVNRILHKNYNILTSLNKLGKTKIKRTQLLHEGFDFSYFTSTYTTKKGATYYICYDEGYLELSDEMYLLIHWEGYE